MILTSTSLPQTSAAVVPTSDPEARASEYKDTWLCFNVEVLRVGLPMECPEVKDFTVGGQPALWVTLGCYPPLAMDQRWIAEKLWGLSTSENAGLCTSS